MLMIIQGHLLGWCTGEILTVVAVDSLVKPSVLFLQDSKDKKTNDIRFRVLHSERKDTMAVQ